MKKLVVSLENPNGALLDLTPAEVVEIEAARLPAAVEQRSAGLKSGAAQQIAAVNAAIEDLDEKLAAKTITAARRNNLTDKKNALLRRRRVLKKLDFTVVGNSVEEVEAYTPELLIVDAETLAALNGED